MFYQLSLEKELELAPRFFGPRMREVLSQKLVSEARGRQRAGRGGGNRAATPPTTPNPPPTRPLG